MSLERTDQGTTPESGNGTQPKDQAPPKDTPGAPGCPSRAESRAAARGEAPNTDSQRADAQKPPADKNGAPEQDRQTSRDDRRSPASDERDSSGTPDQGRGERPEPSGNGQSKSLTPRLDSRRAAAAAFEPGTRDAGGTAPGRDAEDQPRNQQDKRPGKEPGQNGAEAARADDDRSPVQEPSEPDARVEPEAGGETPAETDSRPETADGGSSPGPEQPRQDAGEQPRSPGDAEPEPEGTREADGSWNRPQERPEAAENEPGPLVPEGQPDRENAPPGERAAESAADTTDPPAPQAPATRDDSPFAGAEAFVGADGELKWLLMPELQVQGPGYEGPRSADRGNPLEPIDEETDLGRNPERPGRMGDALRALNRSPDDAQKSLNKTLPKVERTIPDKPPTGYPSVGKDARPEMESPTQAQAGSTMIAGAAVIILAIKAGQTFKGRFRRR